MRWVAGVFVVVVVALTGVAGVAPARGEDAPFVNWPALLPPLATGFTPGTFDTCRSGAPECVRRTLAEMDRRLTRHDAACNHNALFLRNYRLVTRTYAALPAGYFDDDRYLAHEDAVFARLYFDAEDAWRAGRTRDVPEAWRIAFAAADGRRVQGAGNLLLGINAHVQRDMPYLMAGLGLVGRDGKSHKPDHDRFNAVLNDSYDDVLEQATEQDDPDLAMYDVPGTADGLLEFQGVAGWREGVWRNAERLVRARTPAQRAFVARSIEENAAAWARMIQAAFPYGGPFSPARRDALCAERRRAR
jgi:predicted ester cyclase